MTAAQAGAAPGRLWRGGNRRGRRGARRRWPGAGVHYRSPWPMRLRDGRVVVLFGRRKPPTGIGLIVSEDEGHHLVG